jgi:hypothetical protein
VPSCRQRPALVKFPGGGSRVARVALDGEPEARAARAFLCCARCAPRPRRWVGHEWLGTSKRLASPRLCFPTGGTLGSPSWVWPRRQVPSASAARALHRRRSRSQSQARRRSRRWLSLHPRRRGCQLARWGYRVMRSRARAPRPHQGRRHHPGSATDRIAPPHPCGPRPGQKQNAREERERYSSPGGSQLRPIARRGWSRSSCPLPPEKSSPSPEQPPRRRLR